MDRIYRQKNNYTMTIIFRKALGYTFPKVVMLYKLTRSLTGVAENLPTDKVLISV